MTSPKLYKQMVINSVTDLQYIGLIHNLELFKCLSTMSCNTIFDIISWDIYQTSYTILHAQKKHPKKTYKQKNKHRTSCIPFTTL